MRAGKSDTPRKVEQVLVEGYRRMTPREKLERVSQLNRSLRILEGLGVNAWISGSLASSIFGIPRTTQDADIIADLPLEMAHPLVERLGNDFYADAERITSDIERRASFNVIHLPTMFKVDIFIVGRDSWSKRVTERRRSVEIDEQGTEVLEDAGS